MPEPVRQGPRRRRRIKYRGNLRGGCAVSTKAADNILDFSQALPVDRLTIDVP
jgi:hypothetical protein